MNVIKWVICWFAVFGSTAGEKTGQAAQGVGVVAEYGSWGARQAVDAALYTTETIGYCVKEAGRGLENSSQWVNNYANNELTKDEYRDLYFQEPYTHQQRIVESDWALVE